MVFRNKYVNKLRSRAGKYIAKELRRRYVSKRGVPKLKTVVRDVLALKRVINSEKKHFGPQVFTDPISTTNIFNVGLTNGAGEGMQLINITPQINKGTDRNNRIGNSVRVCSGCVHMNLAGMSAQSNNTTILIEFYRVNNTLYGMTPTPAVLGSDLFSQDPITSRYSSNCSRNPNYFRRFTRLRQVVVKTPQDNAGSSNFIKQLTIPFKFKKYHIRWDDSSTSLSGQAWTSGEIFMVVRCNNGNGSATVASLASNSALNLNTAVSTGFQFQFYTDFYYYDN